VQAEGTESEEGMTRRCTHCRRHRPLEAFTNGDSCCQRCRDKAARDLIRDRERRAWERETRRKSWSVVRDAYHLTEQDEQILDMAAQHYGRTGPSADDVISAYTRDLLRQCELLTALGYRLRRVS
jgi:hypothetical protein